MRRNEGKNEAFRVGAGAMEGPTCQRWVRPADSNSDRTSAAREVAGSSGATWASIEENESVIDTVVVPSIPKANRAEAAVPGWRPRNGRALEDEILLAADPAVVTLVCMSAIRLSTSRAPEDLRRGLLSSSLVLREMLADFLRNLGELSGILRQGLSVKVCLAELL
ncbi:hypothetical protein Tco_0184638 [Tanacetum coccineum]